MKDSIIKNYLKLYRFFEKINDKIIFYYGMKRFGIHPKNVFNYRSEFFVESVNKNDIVIDIACGTGLILKKISNIIKKGYGIDFSDQNIKISEKKHSADNLEFIKNDIFKIDYKKLKKKTSYGTAIFSHILEHVEDVPRLLKKIGAEKILICVPSRENWRTDLLIYLNLPYFTDRTHFREYTREILKKDVDDAGYKIKHLGFNSEGEIVCSAIKK